MKIIYSLLIASLLCFLFDSCKYKVEGEGAINLHNVTIKSFDKLYLEIPAHIVVEESDSAIFSIACQDNIFSELYIHNVGKKLFIETGKQFNVQRPIEIKITTPKIDYIDISGQGQVDYNPTKYQSELKINLTGSGKVYSKINTGSIDVTINDNGDAILSGKSDLLKGTLNGPGDVHAYELVADKCKFEINGSGNVRCSPSTLLKATINGSGDIYYKGTPEIKSEITGAGQIKRESK
ncbi:MAG: head GIN domain-containing protein [Bacteroidota bacterium]